MDIRLIRTKADYRAALKEVDRLWEADPGTPEGDRVDVLVTLIEAYEAKHHPIPAPRSDRRHRVHDGAEGPHPPRPRARHRQPRSRLQSAHPQAPADAPMVRALSALLEIPTDVLVQAYETRSAA
jgi:HTH-type transcriptional regulator / antitoxin HigA